MFRRFALAFLVIGIPVAGHVLPGEGDRQREEILARGNIIRTEPLGSGTSRPLKVTIRDGSRIHLAVFKSIDQQPDRGFADTYRHDRAAYLLDRLLGLDMVPVTVIRAVDRKRGALVDWIPGAIDELDRHNKDLWPADRKALQDQWMAMEMFDALIANPDRNPGNQLYTRPEWKLYLIDHTRAFSRYRKIPDHFRKLTARIPRSVFEKLKTLDEGAYTTVTRTLLSTDQIRDLFYRRDLIVKKIEGDIASYGESAVLID